MNFGTRKSKRRELPVSGEELSRPLFVAIPLHPSLLKMLTAFTSNYNSLNISWISEANYHVTLLYLGRINPDLVAEVQSSLAGCIKTIHPFFLSFQVITVIQKKGRGKMIWAKYAENDEFTSARHKILDALKPLVNLNITFSKPVPHVTLSRLKRQAALTGMSFTIPGADLGIDVKHCELWESNKGNNGTFYMRLCIFEMADR